MVRVSPNFLALAFVTTLFMLCTATLGKMPTTSEEMSLRKSYRVILEEETNIRSNIVTGNQKIKMIMHQQPNTNKVLEAENTKIATMENVLTCAGVGAYCNPTFGPNCCRGSTCLNPIPITGGVCV